MSHKAIKIGLTAVVLVAAFSALLFTTLQDNLQYYKYVDEVAAAPQEWHGKTLQVHGYVVPGSVRGTADRLNWKFDLQRNGKVISGVVAVLQVGGTAYCPGCKPVIDAGAAFANEQFGKAHAEAQRLLAGTALSAEARAQEFTMSRVFHRHTAMRPPTAVAGEGPYVIDGDVGFTHVRGDRAAITRTQRSPVHYFQRPDADHTELDPTRTSLTGYSIGVNGGKNAGTWRFYGWVDRTSPGLDVSDLGFLFGSVDRQSTGTGLGYVRSRPAGPFRDFQVFTAETRLVWTTAWERTETWVRPLFFAGNLRNNWYFNFNPIAFDFGERDIEAPLLAPRQTPRPAMCGIR